MADYQPPFTQPIGMLSGLAPALRSRNFRLLWQAQIVSTMGTFLQVVAENWLLYDLTGSTLLLGAVGFLGLIPVVPIALLGGVIIDRVPKRKLIMITQLGLLAQATIFGLLIVTNLIRVWHIAALDFVLGALFAVDTPARQAFLAEIVSEDDLANAVALNATLFQLSRVVGQAASGLLIASLGAGGAMLLNAASYVIPLLALSRMRLDPRTRVVERASLGVALSEGVTTLLRQFALIGTISLMVTAGGLPFATSLMMPAYAEDVLGTSPIGLGVLLACGAVGSVLGSLVVAKLGRVRRGRLLTAAGFLVPLLLLGLAATRNLLLACAVFAGVGLAQCVLHATATTLIQVNVPDRVRGRVMSLYAMVIVGAPKLVGVFLGGIAEPLGLPLAIILVSATVLVYVTGLYAFMPTVRQLE